MRVILLFIILFSHIFSKDLINVHFKDLELKELIIISSKLLGKNILVTTKLEGKVDFISSYKISKKDLLLLLEATLESKGFKLIDKGSFFHLINKKNLKGFDKNYSSKAIFLQHVDAQELKSILDGILSNRGEKVSITIAKNINALILDGELEHIKSLQEVIKDIDVQKRQVYIKADIVELDDSLVEEIGINFGILGSRNHSGNIYTFSSNLNGGKAISVDTSILGLEIPNISSSLALGASLNLLNRTYALEIISQPSILCLNNSESSIYVGETVSIQTASVTTDGGTTKNSFKREDIGLLLKVRPLVSNNRVNLEISTIVEGIKSINSASLNPDTSKKEIKTKAILNNGESVIIGGLIEKRNEKRVNKIPYASEVPLIGELFKNRYKNFQNKNLVIIITPYIVPKDKDVSYIRSELTKLKALEDKFLEEVLIRLRANKKGLNLKKSKELKNLELHKKRLKDSFGVS